MKLRAWDLNQMHYQQENSSWQLGIGPYDGKPAVSIPNNGGHITTSHIMRFATKVLYKENGQTVWNDLYEDDIVEVVFENSSGEEITKTARVVWCDDSGAFKLEWNYNKHQHHIYLMDSWLSIKVIGNVYETPDIELSNGNYWK